MSQTRTFCDHLPRRDVLRIGVAGLFGGLSLARLLEAQANSPDAAARGNGVSLIILFLKGGMSTIDTFDLKPVAKRQTFKPAPGPVVAGKGNGLFGAPDGQGGDRLAHPLALRFAYHQHRIGRGDGDDIIQPDADDLLSFGFRAQQGVSAVDRGGSGHHRIVNE